jgi:hypothetical protein
VKWEYHGNMFKPKESLVAKVVRCLNLTYDDYVLDARSVLSIGIVARFCLIMSSWVREEGGHPHRSKQSCLVSMAYYCMLGVKLERV